MKTRLPKDLRNFSRRSKTEMLRNHPTKTLNLKRTPRKRRARLTRRTRMNLRNLRRRSQS